MTHHARCHCGAVRLSFPTLHAETMRRCDCSLCRRRGALVVSVPVAELTVERGETLTLYQFHSRTARHYFCAVCGIYTHHRRRSNPDEYGVNVGCIEGIDIRAQTEWSWEDGVNHPNDAPGHRAAREQGD